MSVADGRLKNYYSLSFSPLNWGATRSRRRGAMDANGERTRCERHLALVPPERPEESAPLTQLLLELQSEAFLQMLVAVDAGRELLFFSNNQLIGRLVAALRTPGALTAVESTLDALFAAHEHGRMFEHTEVTMGLLYAVRMAAMPGWEDIVTVFANSKSAEFSALRRFARRLIR